MILSRKMASIGKECVACGCCTRVCPKEAIQIAWGISARVDQENASAAGSVRRYALQQ